MPFSPIGLYSFGKSLLQLLRPFSYNCPRLNEIIEKSRQAPEYQKMAKKNKVRTKSSQQLGLHMYDLCDGVISHNNVDLRSPNNYY